MACWHKFLYSLLLLFLFSFQLESLKGLQRPSGSKQFLPLESKGIMHQTIEQTMERLPNGTRRLAALLRTPISIDSIWNILTDYDNLSNHIPNLVSSKVISRDANRVHLAQVGAQKLMGLRFSAQVQLELIENRDLGVLSFHLIKGDFRRFEGLWKMKQLKENNGTCLLYELTVQGCLGMPVALIEQRLRGDLKTNLLAVEQAALKRK